jgi:predicted Ser/Thr protein kinase
MTAAYSLSRLGLMTDRPNPDWLRPGDLVGPWRIEGYAGRGSYGVVFLARRAGHPSSRPVALKVAQCPDDPRFVREVGLLSRVQHPSLPQLLDRGWWRASTGAVHPYIAMEWIRGQTLYEWGRRHNPTSRQVLKVAAQLAWGLEAVHRAEGLHRDVRGDNILVEPEGRAVLTDFGSCTWRGAPPLTQRVMPPNTREYRSPEAVRFEREHWRDKDARYEASTADDLHALAVSIYRLLTGQYPPADMRPEAGEGSLQAPPPARMPPQALNPRVSRELEGLVEQGLAEEPQARGRAREIAQAADIAAERAGPEADVALFQVQAATEVREAMPAPVSARHSAKPRAMQLGVIATTTLAALALCHSGHEPTEQAPELAWAEAREMEDAPDGGTKGLGEESLATRVDAEEMPAPSSSSVIAINMLEKPLAGQLRPPCPKTSEVINEGCWKRQVDIEPPCGAYYEWRGACYLPVMKPPRIPTTREP